jgi:hypothetical protein
VGIEEARDPRGAPAQAFGEFEALEEVGQAVGIVTRQAGETLPQAVGHALLVPAVGGQAAPLEKLEEARDPLHHLLAGGRVARRHVHDLVAQHVGQLVLAVAEKQKPARDEDVAPR